LAFGIIWLCSDFQKKKNGYGLALVRGVMIEKPKREAF